MFVGCTSLVGGRGTTYGDSFTDDATYVRPDGGTSSPGYFTAETITGLKDLNIFNLAGQRLSKPIKGINIIGGKKVAVK